MNLEDESARATIDVQAHDGQDILSRMQQIGFEATSMLHDLNNSLQIVVSRLKLAAEGSRDGRQARHLAIAQIGVDRCLQLARRTLDRGRNTGAANVLVMHGVLPGLGERLRCATGGGITLDIVVNGEDLAIQADEAALENALLNLVLNARDAMDGQGRIRISCGPGAAPEDASSQPDRGSGHVVLRVEDTGPGIPPGIAWQVTRPFFTTKANGIGLGLSNVKAFVEAAGGIFSLDLRPGSGTAVVLSFPRQTYIVGRHAAG